ncbi:Bug family tripartite tricarboxylate transporter substrate binding protein [Falsiroseomonas sp. HW251]|uniref:Bug family tripartite tricarboxylate transporter substrate binding protein n=1 Tax=Falsiroseomonas sp. HW251 TaxID=3390998 RepID=UPI003D31E372
MTLRRRRLLRVAAAAPLLQALSYAARAQAYPTRPVRVIVPFPPGGPTNLVARLITQRLTEQLGKPFIVENIGGAGGNIGMGRAARSAPDGYTLLVTGPNLVVNPSLYDQSLYDPERDFAAVTMAMTAPTALTVHPSLPARTVEELVALIRAEPGRYSYASPGVGTPAHLVGELFRLSLRLDLVHAPFASGGLAVTATLAGHTPISFSAVPVAVPYVRDGRLRALAITSPKRASAVPDIATMAELGHPDIAADIWTAVLAPSGTPDWIIARLQSEISDLLRMPETQSQLSAQGYDPVGNTPVECAAQLREEASKWTRVIREAGIRAQ